MVGGRHLSITVYSSTFLEQLIRPCQLGPSHSLIQFSSVAQSCPTLSDSMNRSTPGLPVHHQLPESTQTHVHCVSDAILLFSVVPFSSCPESFLASGSFQVSQLLASRGQTIGVSASISVLPKKHPGLISFRMGWLALLAVQGTHKSLLQHHSSKASIQKTIKHW